MIRPVLPLPAVLAAAALFMTAFTNGRFFRNAFEAFGATPGGWLHLASVTVVLYCMVLAFLVVLCSRRTAKPVLGILFFLSAGAAYFMDSFNIIIDSGAIVNAVATDAAEASDLLTVPLFYYLALLGVLPTAVLWRTQIVVRSFRRELASRLGLVGGSAVAIAILMMASSPFYASFIREHKALRYYTNPLTPLHSLYRYSRPGLLNDPGPLVAIGEDAHTPIGEAHRELIIMVVGETARADHFSLNGYQRRTNPKLEQERVISFTQVTSCGTSTAISVPCMFSRAGHGGLNRLESRLTENALDVLAHAGVNILWRDNNSDSKGVSQRVPTEDFKTAEHNPVCDLECRDEGMLDGLQEYVDQHASGDLLIVLHQMGSHGPAYYKRYPAQFGQFGPGCESKELDSCSRQAISNSYDNSILYTDHFLSEVIAFLGANDPQFETAMFYVSDHGESLGEYGMYLHGAPSLLAPEAQTHVPMIMWIGRSNDDVDPTALADLRDAPFSHDNVFHTLLGFFEIQSEVYDPHLDILQRSREIGGHAHSARSKSALSPAPDAPANASVAMTQRQYSSVGLQEGGRVTP